MRATADKESVLLLAADARELSGVFSHCDNVVRLQWPVDWCYGARLCSQRVILVANGPGEVLAAEALDVALRREKLIAVVSTGYCGALNPDLLPGEIVVATRIESLERGGSVRGAVPFTSRLFREGVLYTSGRVVRTAAEKRKLNKRGGDAVDMEAASIGTQALSLGIEFYSIRAVTDLAGEDLNLDFEAARGPDGRFHGWKILSNALARPWPCLPELWKLRGRASLASKRLGAFLAECRFATLTGC